MQLGDVSKLPELKSNRGYTKLQQDQPMMSYTDKTTETKRLMEIIKVKRDFVEQLDNEKTCFYNIFFLKHYVIYQSIGYVDGILNN